jgi:2-dehydropantoate 2-reductase
MFATALTDASIADALAMPSTRPLYIALAREILAVAAARGVCPQRSTVRSAAYLATAPHGAAERSLDALVAHNRPGEVAQHLARPRGAQAARQVDAQLGIVVTLGTGPGYRARSPRAWWR